MRLTFLPADAQAAAQGASRFVSKEMRIHGEHPSWTAALPLAPVAPQGCVALRAPVLRTPLSRAGFAVAGLLAGGVEHKGNIISSLSRRAIREEDTKR